MPRTLKRFIGLGKAVTRFGRCFSYTANSTGAAGRYRAETCCPRRDTNGSENSTILHDGIMLFRRRKPVTISERLGAFFWPRKGFTRAPRYIALRVLRLNSSPHAIAVGVAAGAASSLTPFFGLHIVLAVLLASAFSGNLVAAAITTVLANPVTIPVILTASYEVGTMLTQPQAAQAVGGQEIMRQTRRAL